MDLRHFRRFVVVAELKSMNKAAQQLRLSQPALSNSIQLLEESLGVTLLDRGNRGVTLTEFGRSLFRRAKMIESEVRKLDEELLALRDLATGSINVGIPLGSGVLTQLLGAATVRLVSPGRKLTINYATGTREGLLRPLLFGDLDFVITAMANDGFSEEVSQEELYVDRLAFLVRRSHPLATVERVTPGHLAQFSWMVLSENIEIARNLQQIAHDAGVPFHNSLLSSNSGLLIRTILLQSDIVGLVRQDTIAMTAEQGELIELKLHDAAGVDIVMEQHIGIVSRRDSHMSVAAAALIDEIRQECRMLSSSRP